jgi:hypothetical protein
MPRVARAERAGRKQVLMSLFRTADTSMSAVDRTSNVTNDETFNININITSRQFYITFHIHIYIHIYIYVYHYSDYMNTAQHHEWYVRTYVRQ